MERLLFTVLCLVLCITLCSCQKSELFSIGYNRVTVYDSYWVASVSDAVYSYELYQNPALPLKQYGPGIYYYFMADYDSATPPLLSVIDPFGEVRTLCTDPQCYHNSLSYTRRCILCDIYDTTRIATLGGYIYFARADKTYYNEGTGKVEYVINSDIDDVDEIEFEYTLVRYDPASGFFHEQYTVEPGSYIDFITGYGSRVYFYETTYELIENQEFSYINLKELEDESGRVVGSYGFIDSVTGRVEFYDATLFYDHSTYRWPFVNIKENRKMTIKDNKPYKKVYKLQRLDTDTGAVETLATRDSLPQAFHIFDKRIYELRDDGFYSYDLDCTIDPETGTGPVKILNAFDAAGAKSFQYDQFTKNIYYLKNGTLYKVKTEGEFFRVVRSHDLCPGNIAWYQISFEGVYFMKQGDSTVYLAQYLDINYENVPYEKAFEPGDELLQNNGYISAPTVIDEKLYFLHTCDREYVSPDGSNRQVAPYTTGVYRYTFETGELEYLRPEGWTLGR